VAWFDLVCRLLRDKKKEVIIKMPLTDQKARVRLEVRDKRNDRDELEGNSSAMPDVANPG